MNFALYLSSSLVGKLEKLKTTIAPHSAAVIRPQPHLAPFFKRLPRTLCLQQETTDARCKSWLRETLTYSTDILGSTALQYLGKWYVIPLTMVLSLYCAFEQKPGTSISLYVFDFDVRKLFAMRSKCLHVCVKSALNHCNQSASSFILILQLAYFIQALLFSLLQSVTDFLKGLPSYNESNFTKYHNDGGIRNNAKRPSVYLPTVDHPSDQSIASNYNFN